MERGLSGVIGVQRGGSFVLSAVLGLVLVLGAFDAEAARRLGGGMSVGKQSGNVARRDAAPAQQQSAPAQSSAASAPASTPANAGAAAPAASTAAAASPARRSGMMGMLGGVAAGLGLAWLASSLGLGAAFGQFMLIALLVLLAFVAFRWLTRPRPAASNRYAFQGGAGVATIPSAYYPENVGNDASARPWEQGQGGNANPGAGQSGVVIGSALSGSASSGWSVPAGFDVESFIKVAKSNFIHLQAAWDKADMVSLRSMMTDDMLTEISAQLAERERLSGGAPNLTEVQMLQAQLLGIEDLGGEYMASVEFSGMVREDRHSAPSPFREVWNMTKPSDGSRGWLVAGVQALQ